MRSKGQGGLKCLVNGVGQYNEVVGFDYTSVWKCLWWCSLVCDLLKFVLKFSFGSSLLAIVKCILGVWSVEASKVAVLICLALKCGLFEKTHVCRGTEEVVALFGSHLGWEVEESDEPGNCYI